MRKIREVLRLKLDCVLSGHQPSITGSVYCRRARLIPRTKDRRADCQTLDTWPKASEQWIAHHRNVLLTGPTGVGKSYIACTLGNFAARQGHTVLYLSPLACLQPFSNPKPMARI